MAQCTLPSEQSAARAQGLDPDPDADAGSPPWVEFNCSRRSASALPLLTFKAPASALPLSSTSTHRPPIWLPVLDGTQTMCFPLVAAVVACDGGTGFKSKFSCVGPSALVFVLLIEALTAPFTTSVTR